MKRLLTHLFALLAVSFASSSFANEKADPRAVTECTKSGGSFVEVNNCLPGAHVAFVEIDAILKVYGEGASPLITKCRELNDNEMGAATCAENAIEAAISLKTKLSDSSKLDDKLFELLSDPKMWETVQEATSKAKGLFPEKLVWGGNIYHPYKN